MKRSLRVYAALAVLIFTPTISRHVSAQTPAPSSIAGKWDGTVTADIGAMRIVVALTEKAGIVTGQIENAHGVFAIKEGTLAAGEWLLPFESEDGAKGTMKGKLTGDDFTGKWDFSPRAVGTFALKRVK